jgi:hypothetical protein
MSAQPTGGAYGDREGGLIAMSPSNSSFIDTMRPVTSGEGLAWSVYISLPYERWRAAREMFRRAHDGWDVQSNLRSFVANTGAPDEEMIASLKTAFKALEKERAHERPVAGWAASRNRSARVGDPLYATGKMTILENSEPVTPKIVERWRGEVLPAKLD